MNLRAMATLGLVLLGGCGRDRNDIDCTLMAEPGIVVEVVDRDTGAFIAWEATGNVRDGAYVDTLHAYESDRSLAGAYERAGTYDITVTHIGYQDWSRFGVEVTGGTCHVHTERVIAEMIPSG